MNSEIDHFLFLNHKKTVYEAVRPYKYYTLKFSLLSLVETGWNLLRSDFDKEKQKLRCSVSDNRVRSLILVNLCLKREK